MNIDKSCACMFVVMATCFGSFCQIGIWNDAVVVQLYDIILIKSL